MTGLSSRGRTLLAATALLVGAATGCYEQRSGNPVDTHHYEHVITVFPDRSHVGIKTYVNRSHLQVGIRFEDLFDGDRDGKLITPGMDRAHVADYLGVDDPPEAATRSTGDLPDYDQLFQRILEAVTAGRGSFTIEDRRYEIRVLSSNVGPTDLDHLSSIE